MENNMLKETLERKAVEVKQHLAAFNYHCTFVLIQYGIKFTIYLAGRTAEFNIYYKAKNSTWKHYTADEWVNSELQSKINPLLGLSTTPVYGRSSTVVASAQASTSVQAEPSLYFEAALECLRILQPFAKEYIDFSIICQQVKIGLQGVLTDSRYAYLDQQALQEALHKPLSPDFSYAKEYLTQCLMLCQIPTQL